MPMILGCFAFVVLAVFAGGIFYVAFRPVDGGEHAKAYQEPVATQAIPIPVEVPTTPSAPVQEPNFGHNPYGVPAAAQPAYPAPFAASGQQIAPTPRPHSQPVYFQQHPSHALPASTSHQRSLAERNFVADRGAPAVSQPAKRRSEHADVRIGEVERTLRADEQRPALESSRGIGATFDAVVRHVIEKEVEKTPTAATKGYGAITGEVVNIYNGQVTIGENVMNGGLNRGPAVAGNHQYGYPAVGMMPQNPVMPQYPVMPQSPQLRSGVPAQGVVQQGLQPMFAQPQPMVPGYPMQYYYPIPMPGYSSPQYSQSATQHTVPQVQPNEAFASQDPELDHLQQENLDLLATLRGISEDLGRNAASSAFSPDIPGDARPDAGLAPAVGPKVVSGVKPSRTMALDAPPRFQDSWEDWERAVSRGTTSELAGSEPFLSDSFLTADQLTAAFGAMDAAQATDDAMPDSGNGVSYNTFFRREDKRISPGFRAGPLRLEVFDTLLSAPGKFDQNLVDEQFQPSEAKFRLGNLFLDASHITVGAAWSDNFGDDYDGEPKDAGMVSFVALEDVAGIIQLSEGFQWSVRGDFVWLINDEIGGASGFGLDKDVADMAFGKGQSEIFRTEFSQEARAGGWDILITNELMMGDAGITGEFDGELWSQLELLEERGLDVDSATELRLDSFMTTGSVASSLSPVNRSQTPAVSRFDSRSDIETRIMQNNLGLYAEKVLPTQTRISSLLWRQDILDTGLDQDVTEGEIESWSEGWTLKLDSQRDMRFKPALTYQLEHDNLDEDWQESAVASFTAPLTDYIYSTGSMGYTRFHGVDQGEVLSDLHVSHQPNPDLIHSVSYSRTVIEPKHDIASVIRYSLQQRLGPHWLASFVSGRQTVKTLADGGDNDEWTSVGSITFTPGRRLSMSLRTGYSEGHDGRQTPWDYQFSGRYQFRDNIVFDYTQTWQDYNWDSEFNARLQRGRLEAAYRWTAEEADSPTQSRAENLLVLSYKVPLHF